MWTLFIITSVLSADGSMDAQYTRYAEYQTPEVCSIEAALQEANFQNGESAMCEFVGDEPGRKWVHGITVTVSGY
jgi:hypothetical protein